MVAEIHDTSNRAFDRKLARILRSAAKVFARDGYGGASIRAVAADAEVSLAGLYHYVKSKEELLYLIQLHSFRSIVDNLHDALRDIEDPRLRLGAAVRNHLEHFVAHMAELKVCAVELDTLGGEFYDEVAEIRREYFKVMLELVDGLRAEGVEGPDPRLSTLSLFGSLNWLFQWYDPQRDLDAAALAKEFTQLFVRGFLQPGDGGGR